MLDYKLTFDNIIIIEIEIVVLLRELAVLTTLKPTDCSLGTKSIAQQSKQPKRRITTKKCWSTSVSLINCITCITSYIKHPIGNAKLLYSNTRMHFNTTRCLLVFIGFCICLYGGFMGELWLVQ